MLVQQAEMIQPLWSINWATPWVGSVGKSLMMCCSGFWNEQQYKGNMLSHVDYNYDSLYMGNHPQNGRVSDW